ncbi:MAG: SET domain-containing protein [Xanthomonadales bacterium]|nr:SET domain-containing protein [Xanthomonadales bacterium]
MQEYDDNPLCYVADSPIHGRGLFARRDIERGTWIGHYDGPQTQENGMHVLWIEADVEVDEEWIGYDGNNELRFLNHDPHPNGEMDGLDLYAAQTIRAGEEITIDYGEEFEAA